MSIGLFPSIISIKEYQETQSQQLDAGSPVCDGEIIGHYAITAQYLENNCADLNISTTWASGDDLVIAVARALPWGSKSCATVLIAAIIASPRFSSRHPAGFNLVPFLTDRDGAIIR